jgi:hypothetical protein
MTFFEFDCVVTSCKVVLFYVSTFLTELARKCSVLCVLFSYRILNTVVVVDTQKLAWSSTAEVRLTERTRTLPQLPSPVPW